MRILLTGSSGFIGRNLLAGLRLDYEISAPSHQELDLLDPLATSRYLQNRSFDVIVHAATWDATQTSQRDSSLVLANNLKMFANLYREQMHFGKLIHFGSGAEYDRRHWHGGMREEEAESRVPEDDYGLSKCLISRLSLQSEKVLNLRLFAVFGPGEDWRTRFISSNICRAIFDVPLSLKQDRDFDFLHVEDVVSVVRALLAKPESRGTLNVSRGSTASLSSIAGMILESLGKELPIEILLPGKDLAYGGDNHRLCDLLSWKPHALSDGISVQVKWMQDHASALDPSLLLVPQ